MTQHRICSFVLAHAGLDMAKLCDQAGYAEKDGATQEPWILWAFAMARMFRAEVKRRLAEDGGCHCAACGTGDTDAPEPAPPRNDMAGPDEYLKAVTAFSIARNAGRSSGDK